MGRISSQNIVIVIANTMPQAFEDASQVRREGPGRFTLEVPDGWQQGRGAFGGLVIGSLVRAMLIEAPAGGSLRTVTASICGPVLAGAARVEVETLRAGKRLTFMRATLRQGADFGEIKSTATATVGAARPVQARSLAPTAPQTLGPWQDCPIAPMRPPLGPVFTQHYEYRNLGPAPFGASDEPRAAGWIRNAADPAKHDAPAIMGLLDAFWPAEFALDSAPRPMATVSFTAELFVDPTQLQGSDPFDYRARTEAARDGFATEFRELWREGALIALNQQTFVALG